MDDGRKAALRQKREDLRTGIRVKDIFPDLHEAVGGFLDDVGEDKVRSKENNVEQVDELIDILLMKENKDFDYFCTVVEKGNRTRANNLRQAAGLGQSRSSSSQVPQRQPLALGDSPARGASAPVVPPNDGSPGDWRRQQMDLLQPATGRALLPQQGAGALAILPSTKEFLDDRMEQPVKSQELTTRESLGLQGDTGPHDRHPASRMGQPFGDPPSTLPPGPSPGYMEDVDVGEEDVDGSPSCSKDTMMQEMNFTARAGEHLVQERIWNEVKSAVVCIRPNGELNEETGTAFIGEAPNGRWIMLSACHCFLEKTEEEEEDMEEVDGVAIEEQLVRPASRKENVVQRSEIDLQLESPDELKRMIEDSDDDLLRDRILCYHYWFCYEEKHVSLKGEDFVAKHVRVEYDVRRDIIAFSVKEAKIKAALAAARPPQVVHPIKLDKVKDVSDPRNKGRMFWCKRSATAYGFPLGRPLSRSGGRIVNYIPATAVRTERIAYQVRTEGGSSGGPVFLTFGDDNPIVVAIHCESGTREEACNYGTLLWPFLQRTNYF